MNCKDDTVYLEHMLVCIQKINEYTEGSKEKFFNSTLVQDAVIRNLQVLAESSQRISDKLKSTQGDIPWREISGFRNILVHDYLGIDCETIWSVVEQDIPALTKTLEKMFIIIVNIMIGAICTAILIISAEFVVKKLITIAHHFGVSNTFIGLTVLSVGTSLPEIGSHVVASIGILSGKLDYKVASSTVLGANIGSDVVQQTFVLGLVILFMGSVVFKKTFLRRSYTVMVGTTLLTLLLGFDGTISRIDGLILLACFAWYIYFLYKVEDRLPIRKEKIKYHIALEISLALGGMAMLFISSSFVLAIVQNIVEITGIAGSLIGVFTLGIASALPEMLTAIMGIRHHANGLSLGTLIGSNITNPLVAIGLGGLISTYYVPRPLIYWDLPMETITAAMLLIYLMFNKNKLGRGGAIYLMLLYVAYAAIRIMMFNLD